MKESNTVQLRMVPERRSRSSRLVIELLVPVPGFNANEMKARIVIVVVTVYERANSGKEWVTAGCKYICGTPDAFYLRGFKIPFKVFDTKVLSGIDNQYAAANEYVRYMAASIRRLVPRVSSLKYVTLKPCAC